jgi:Na+/H+ antiporter NhaA
VPTRHPPVEGSWSAGQSPAARRLAIPLREFLDTEVAGGLVLPAATAVALLWTSSPWQATYEAIWETELAFEVGQWALALDLRHWINDGLLGVIAGLPRMGVVWWPVHVLLGVGVWLATYASGVQATIAGVALGLLMPTRPLVRHLSASLGDDIQPSAPVVRWVRKELYDSRT